MTRAQLFFANAVGTAGLFAGWSWTGAAQIFAYIGTGVWMFAQAYVLLRRQRCTVPDCKSRKA